MIIVVYLLYSLSKIRRNKSGQVSMYLYSWKARRKQRCEGGPSALCDGLKQNLAAIEYAMVGVIHSESGCLLR